MSTYFTSDLHGDFRHFVELLKLIQFDANKDYMYVLGDVLDRENENLRLLKHIRAYVDEGSMLLLKGNHELFAQMYLEDKLDAGQWTAWGGKHTLTEINKLDPAEKEELKAFICRLPLYKIISVNNKTLLLTHSGLEADNIVESENRLDVEGSIRLAADKDEFRYLISNDIHYMPAGKIKRLDHFVVVGHVPTMGLNDDGSYHIVHREKYMCIDTGAGHRNAGGRMSCYRVDDGKEFYV